MSKLLGEFILALMSIENCEVLTHTIEFYNGVMLGLVAVEEGREPLLAFRAIM